MICRVVGLHLNYRYCVIGVEVCAGNAVKPPTVGLFRMRRRRSSIRPAVLIESRLMTDTQTPDNS